MGLCDVTDGLIGRLDAFVYVLSTPGDYGTLYEFVICVRDNPAEWKDVLVFAPDMEHVQDDGALSAFVGDNLVNDWRNAVLPEWMQVKVREVAFRIRPSVTFSFRPGTDITALLGVRGHIAGGDKVGLFVEQFPTAVDELPGAARIIHMRSHGRYSLSGISGSLYRVRLTVMFSMSGTNSWRTSDRYSFSSGRPWVFVSLK